MRNALAIAVLLASTAGCFGRHARGQVSDNLTPCAKDLVMGSYAAGSSDDEREKNAEAYCAKYSASEIAHAKDVVDSGYVKQFRHAIEKVAGATDAEYACAKAEREKINASGFSINSSCKGAVNNGT